MGVWLCRFQKRCIQGKTCGISRLTLPKVRLFGSDENATLSAFMTTRSVARLLAVGSMCVFALIGCFAQAPSTPPVHPQAQTAPGEPPNNPSSKLRPTGLEANGGSITAGIYTNSIYGFSLQVP